MIDLTSEELNFCNELVFFLTFTPSIGKVISGGENEKIKQLLYDQWVIFGANLDFTVEIFNAL